MGPGITYRTDPNRTKYSFEGASAIFKFAGTEIQGWRLSMEDAHLAITNYDNDPAAALFAVFDGHGGQDIAEFSKRRFPGVLSKNKNYLNGDYEKALFESFLEIDKILASEEGREEVKAIHAELLKEKQDTSGQKNNMNMMMDVDNPDNEGCTANVILFKKEYIYIANAGDSRSVLAVNGKATDLSLDHKPDDINEKKRITAAGGSVTNGRIEGNLNLSRCLGDLQYKKNISLPPEQQMITCAPDVKKMPIGKDFDFIVMGCDGIYDNLSSQQIIDKFTEELKANPTKPLTTVVEEFVDSLVSEDFTKTEGKGCDNMTCILIKFNR